MALKFLKAQNTIITAAQKNYDEVEIRLNNALLTALVEPLEQTIDNSYENNIDHVSWMWAKIPSGWAAAC